MSFTERDVTVVHAELKAVCRCVQKLIMVRKSAASYQQKETNPLRLLEKLTAWKTSYGFNRCDVHDGQGRGIMGMCAREMIRYTPKSM